MGSDQEQRERANPSPRERPLRPGTIGGGKKVTWVVICTPADGQPFSEYVEGTELVTDQARGALTIFDGDRVVREYSAGAWSNFCEWVASYTDFFSRNVIRLAAATDAMTAKINAAQALRAPETALRRDTGDAMALLRKSFNKSP